MDDLSETGHALDVVHVVSALRGEGWRLWLRRNLNRWLGLDEAHALFHRASCKGGNTFLEVMAELGLSMDQAELARSLPEDGAAIVVANHPFGGAEAVALSGRCAELREDCKVLANAVSADLPGVGEWLIPLQIMAAEGAAQANLAAMKQAMSHLRAGGLLVVFPAGAVSRWRWDMGRIADPEWSPHIARLVRKLGVPVLPVKFFGTNPMWFYWLGALHPLLRSALIVPVFLASRGTQLIYRVGQMITADKLSGCVDAKEATVVMRKAVDSIPEK